MPAVSGFSQAFSRILNDFVDGADFSRQDIAKQAQRSRAFISDQLLGKRPVDTDVITAIADLFQVSGRFLTQQVLNQMPPDLVGIPGLTPPPSGSGDSADGPGPITPLPTRPTPPAPVKRAARNKPGKPKMGED